MHSSPRLSAPTPALALLLAAFPLVAYAQAPVDAPAPLATEPPETAVQTITGAELGGHLNFLASDLMRGREAGSHEARLTAEYLASHLGAIGAEPLGDSDAENRRLFTQRFLLDNAIPLSSASEMVLTLDLADGAKRIINARLGLDYAYRPFGIVDGEIDAPAVFVGYGRVDAEKEIDDYAGLSVRNKFVLAFRGSPDDAADSRNDFGSTQAKARIAREKGALGLLLIEPPGRVSLKPAVPVKPRDLWFDRRRDSIGSTPAETPMISLADPIRDVLVSSLALDAPADSSPKSDGGGLKVRFVHAVSRELREDYNVIGYFPGSDPEKKREIIVYSAHYDHEGVDDKGNVYNGSDDNASGTSGLLEIAQAFATAPRPARSVAFLWVSAEEKGLLGSKWFADHHVLPEGHTIVADINLDMISRNDPTKISATPSPKHPDYNTLVVDAVEVSKTEGLEIQFDADPFYHRTDSYNFAAKGIPVIFFFAGLHEDYHKPTDDVEKADLDKTARVARAAFRLGWKAAQNPDAPKKVEAKAAPTDAPAP